MLLFVYGSLKRGYSNHHRLGGRFVAAAATAAKYRLLDLGTYPGMVRDVDGLRVQGEIWDVDDFESLDAFEGEHYSRETVEIPGVSRVQAYFYVGPPIPDARTGAVWPFGED